jgi:acetyltransferase EpsM
MDKVIIIGGKGTAVMIAEQIYDAQHRFGAEIEFLGFAFDDESFGKEINGFPVLCKTTEVKDKYAKFDDVKYLYYLYRHDLMKERVELLKSYGIPDEKFAAFVHPSVMLARSATVGIGTAICAHTVVGSNARIGGWTTIREGCYIGHDVVVGDYNFLSAQVCFGGCSEIGDGSFFGMNSSLRDFTRVGDYCVVGMAANVVADVPSHKVVYGNPAREAGRPDNP